MLPYLGFDPGTSNSTTKRCISLQKIAFCAFFDELQNENCFLKQLVFCSNLLSKLEKSCFEKPFLFLQFIKKAQKAIFGAKYIFIFFLYSEVAVHIPVPLMYSSP